MWELLSPLGLHKAREESPLRLPLSSIIPLLRENCGPQISFVSELSTPFQQGSFCLGDSGSFPVFPRTHSPLAQFGSSSKDLCFKEDTPLLWNSSQKKRWVLRPFYEMINFLENICGPEYCLPHGWWRVLPEIRTFTCLVGSLPDLESPLWQTLVVCDRAPWLVNFQEALGITLEWWPHTCVHPCMHTILTGYLLDP